MSAMKTRLAAKFAELSQRRKYADFAEDYQFDSIAAETMRKIGDSTLVILRATGHQLFEGSADPRDATWFVKTWIQQLNEAIRFVLSQPVGRGFKGSWESSYTQPLTFLLIEYPFA